MWLLSTDKQKKQFRKMILRVVPVLAAILLIAVCFYSFSLTNSNIISERNAHYLEEYTKTLGNKIDAEFNGSLTEIEMLADFTGANDKYDEITPELLKTFESKTDFDFIRYVTSAGTLLTSTGVTLDASEREYFQLGIQGNSGVTIVDQSRVNDERMAVFYAPRLHDGKVIGVFLGLYAEESLSSEIQTFFENQLASSLITTRDGKTIVSSPSSSLARWYNEGNSKDFAHFIETRVNNADAKQILLKACQNGTSTSFDFQGFDGESVGQIIPLQNVDWNLVVMLPSQLAKQVNQDSYKATESFGFKILGICIAYILLLLIMQLSQLNRTREEAKLDHYLASAHDCVSMATVFVDLEEDEYVDISATPLYEKRRGSIDEMIEQAVAAQDNESDAQKAYIFLEEEIQDCDPHGTPPLLDTVFTEKDGTHRFFRSTFVPVESRGRRVTKGVILFSDVTKARTRDLEIRKDLENALAQAKEGIRAKSVFLANVSHDLRTPMNAVLGYASLAKNRVDDPEAVAAYMNKIENSGNQLLAMVDNVLEVSRLDEKDTALSSDHIKLDEFLNKLRNEMLPLIEAKEQSLDIDAHTVHHRSFVADESRLSDALLHLLHNANKYTLHKGHIKLQINEFGHAESGMAHYRFTVSDDGIGITEEFLPHIFDNFSREEASTINKIHGFGLGLALVKNTIERMDGTVNVKSEKGKGSTFTVDVSFPIIDEDRVSSEARAQDPAFLHGKRFLAAEDNEINAEILQALLEKEGASCRICENGQEALLVFEYSEPDEYDAILMDIMMPKMDGLEATRAIRACQHPKASSIPIIAMTANTFSSDKERSKNAGMNAHLGKPINMDELKKTLAKLLP